MVTDLAIGRRFRCAACIANRSSYDTGDTPEPGVDAPESAEGKESLFSLRRGHQVEFWQNVFSHRALFYHIASFRKSRSNTCTARLEDPGQGGWTQGKIRHGVHMSPEQRDGKATQASENNNQRHSPGE